MEKIIRLGEEDTDMSGQTGRITTVLASDCLFANAALFAAAEETATERDELDLQLAATRRDCERATIERDQWAAYATELREACFRTHALLLPVPIEACGNVIAAQAELALLFSLAPPEALAKWQANNGGSNAVRPGTD
ncbi:MAG: hypothetical protein AB7I37_26260 [Pirellulales bacterium]